MSEQTPGQAACIAWNSHYAEQHGIEARNEWAASDPRGRDAWEAAAQAAIDAATEGAIRALGYTLADVGRFIEAQGAARQPQAAPELAAETRAYRERLAAIRELCKAQLGVTAGLTGKGVAKRVIAIIDKPEGK